MSGSLFQKALKIFTKIESDNFDGNICFLCGKNLNSSNKAIEHVIPKWLLKKYDLWNHSFTLLNLSTIKYKNMTIPCCRTCNNTHLSNLEKYIKSNIELGYREFVNIDIHKLYLWLGKLFFGILYKEMFLNLFQNNPSAGSITDSDLILKLRSLHLFLQGIRQIHRFKDFFPASIFILNTQMPFEVKRQWDFVDNVMGETIAIRIGDIGIVAVLEDGGLQSSMEGTIVDHFFDVPLHPLQLRELTAIISYRSILYHEVPNYVSVDDGKLISTIRLPSTLNESELMEREWDNEAYAHVLARYTGYPLEFVWPSQDLLRTWIKDEDGNILYLDVESNPYP